MPYNPNNPADYSSGSDDEASNNPSNVFPIFEQLPIVTSMQYNYSLPEIDNNGDSTIVDDYLNQTGFGLDRDTRDFQTIINEIVEHDVTDEELNNV